MPETDRLSEPIAWIDLSFVERTRTPEWAIQVGIRCHLAGMSLRDASQFLEELGVQRSHVAIHQWVQKADLQPVSTVSADQLALDEKVIRINGDDYWLYGAVDPENQRNLASSAVFLNDETDTRWFLADLHQRYQLSGVEFLVDDADYLGPVLAADGYRLQMNSHGNRNGIERVFWEIERRTSSFATSFNHVNPQTAESWLQAFAVRHNARQT